MQVLHEVDPVESACFPGTHRSQVELPSEAENFPLSQSVQASNGEMEVFPAKHAPHSHDPMTEVYLPAIHLEHFETWSWLAAETSSALKNVPDGQLSQPSVPFPVAEVYFPFGQTSQLAWPASA